MDNLNDKFIKTITKANQNQALEFIVDIADYWDFLNTVVRNNKDLILNFSGGIDVRPDNYNENIDGIICGIAPLWKKYDDFSGFEYFYSNNKTMRSLYANEKINETDLSPIYIQVKDKKYVATWETKMGIDIFHYRQPTLEERGALDILWEIFGGKINEDGLKVLDCHVGISIAEDELTENLPLILTHLKRLGYGFENIRFAKLNSSE